MSIALDLFHSHPTHPNNTLAKSIAATAISTQNSGYKKAPRKQKVGDGSVTQLILTQTLSQQLHLILPLLASPSQAPDKWITWIDIPHELNPSVLEQYGIDTKKVQTLYSTSRYDALTLAMLALKTGRSQLVITSPQQINDSVFQQLEFAAIKGNCHGIIITER